MSIRDLIVYVTANPGAEVGAAMDLAQSHDAHLSALHVVDIPIPPIALEAGVSGAYIEAERQGLLEAAAKAQAQVSSASQKAGKDVEWRLTEGETVHRIAFQARYADMVVMGAAAGVDEPPFKRDLCERTVLETGKPVVIIPQGYSGTGFGRSVTVAWDGSREAARAVADAMPLLQKADRVSVIAVDPDREMGALGDLPGADICHHLARHGVNAEAQTTNSGSASIGETLLKWATGQDADLLVMGAYGHWRLRELVLGGVTRDVLRDPHIPIMMSH